MSFESPEGNPGGEGLVRDRVVMVTGAAATVVVAWLFRDQPLTAAGLAVVLIVSTWLAVIDFRVHRLPNRIVGPLAVGVAAGVVTGGLVGDDLGRTGRALICGVVAAAVLLLANIAGGLGMGDVKYAFPMATTVGWYGVDALMVAVLVTTMAGAVAAVGILLRNRDRRGQLAYGPYMALGLAVGLISAGLG